MTKGLKRDPILSSQRGSAFTEFGIVLPIIILVFFSGYEFSNFIQRWQLTTTYSREAANSVFRECAADRDDASQEVTQRLTICITEQRQKMIDEVSELSSNVEMVISVYEYDADTNTVNRLALIGETPDITSQYQSADFQSPSSTLGQALRENQILVIGEAYLPSGVIGLLSLSSAFFEEAYASTIM